MRDEQTFHDDTPPLSASTVVVSPHLDDAVLGVGDLLAVAASATVVTVYAGSPDVYPDPPKDWVRQCGFGPDDDVAAIRRPSGLKVTSRSSPVLDVRRRADRVSNR